MTPTPATDFPGVPTVHDEGVLKKLVVRPGGGLEEIRYFADSGIQQAITDAVNKSLEPGEKFALVGYMDQDLNAKLAVVVRPFGEHVSIVLAGAKDRGDPLTVAAAVRAAW